MSGGSLLRLFQSEYFDAHLHMHYLLRMEQSGVQDYLVNELYKMTDDDVDYYLPQLSQVALLRYNKSSLHRFLLDKAAQSMPFALKIHWLVQGIVEDKTPELYENAMAMLNLCEAAMVNSSSSSRKREEEAVSPPRVQRILRSSSDPDLQSNRAPPEVEAPESRGNLASSSRHRSRTPGAPMLSREPRHEESVPPTPTDEGEGPDQGEARFNPPPRQTSADSSWDGEGADSSPAGLLSDAEALRAAAARHLGALEQASTPEERSQAFELPASCPNAFVSLGLPIATGHEEEEGEDDRARECLMKRRRCEYFTTQNQLVSLIMALSAILTSFADKAERKNALAATFGAVNRWLLDRRICMATSSEGPMFLLGAHLPLWRDLDSLHQIVHVHVDLCKIFSSATRAPFLLAYESVNLDEADDEASNAHVSHQTLLHQPLTAAEQQSVAQRLSRCLLTELHRASDLPDDEGQRSKRRNEAEELHNLIKQVTPNQWRRFACTMPKAPAKEEPDLQELERKTMRAEARKRRELAAKTRHSIWGEPWQEKVERVRAASPYSCFNSWRLNAVVVKGGDDLRQELLASQIIEQFSAIFQEAGLPLWLRATKVLVTSSSNGFLEFIPDSTSVDAMKKLFPGKTLAEIFKVAFADQLFDAKKNFIESSAAYSLVVYFLQVKDRHNGNLMLLTSGHVVHIDFGFMLSNSPGGNMAFENSPFKLTQEILDVMDGECSEQYEYFRTLLIRGFLEARKHMDRIVLQVRMMLTGSKMPCFREGADFVLSTLQDRFFCNLTEEACIERVVELIDTSVNNWRTIQYDNYQRIVNGIL
ncbi:unnamed protein product [Effrenium voratum]|nr:unnamed protein product [Effrenium voratum]